MLRKHFREFYILNFPISHIPSSDNNSCLKSHYSQRDKRSDMFFIGLTSEKRITFYIWKESLRKEPWRSLRNVKKEMEKHYFFQTKLGQLIFKYVLTKPLGRLPEQ